MFLKVHPELLGPVVTPSFAERFQKCFDYWEGMDNGGWQDWFDEDIPTDLAWPDDTEFMQDLIEELLNEGVTFWYHPGWYSSLWLTFKWWYDEGFWLKLRMYAEWLLSTMPADFVDAHFAEKLKLIASTEFDSLENENYASL